MTVFFLFGLPRFTCSFAFHVDMSLKAAFECQGVAMNAENVENFTAMVAIVNYNISITFDWDARVLDFKSPRIYIYILT